MVVVVVVVVVVVIVVVVVVVVVVMLVVVVVVVVRGSCKVPQDSLDQSPGKRHREGSPYAHLTRTDVTSRGSTPCFTG